jgi:hypothetical protein
MRCFVIWLWVLSLLGMHVHGLVPHHHHIERVGAQAKLVAHHHDQSLEQSSQAHLIAASHNYSLHTHGDGSVQANQRAFRIFEALVAVIPAPLELPAFVEPECQRVEVLTTSVFPTGPPGESLSRGPPVLS